MAFNLDNTLNVRFLGADDEPNGPVAIKKTPSGYVATVKLYYKEGVKDPFPSQNLDVKIALCSSYSVLLNENIKTETVKISDPRNDKATYPFLNFELTGDTYSKSIMKIVNKNNPPGNINFEKDRPEIRIINKCEKGNTSFSCDTLGNGILGMGVYWTWSSVNKQQFRDAQSMLLYRIGDTGDFKIEFGSKISNGYSINAGYEWDAKPTEFQWGMNEKTVEPVDFTVTFDLNEVATTLPLAFYEKVYEKLSKEKGFDCPKENYYYRPLCKFTGDYNSKEFNDLHLRFTYPIDSYLQQVPIWPWEYMKVEKYGDETYLRINLKAGSPTLTGRNYVGKDYEKYVIIGRQYLSQYRTNFKLQSGENRLTMDNNESDRIPIDKKDPYSYEEIPGEKIPGKEKEKEKEKEREKEKEKENNEGKSIWIWVGIVALVLVIIVLIVLAALWFVRRQKQTEDINKNDVSSYPEYVGFNDILEKDSDRSKLMNNEKHSKDYK